MDSALLLVGVALLLLSRRERAPEWSGDWWWPVPDVVERDGARFPAVVSQGFSAAHRGADVMYARPAPSTLPERSGDVSNVSRGHWAPPGVPVLAARAGVVWSAGTHPTGGTVVLDHGQPWATFYAHLSAVRVTKGQAVRAGDVLGFMGANMNTDESKGAVDGERLRHLHFEVWHGGSADHAVNPVPPMASWKRSTWTRGAR